MKWSENGSIGAVNGSITVFLTLIFGVILSVITATFENVRFLTVDSYMMAAADVAAMSVFGEYNRELYQEYGLFGYGGYAGHSVSDLSNEFLNTISKNLSAEPESEGIFHISQYSGDYTSLYRIKNISLELSQIENFTDSAVFYQQIENYLKTQMAADITKEVIDKYHSLTQREEQETIQRDLNTTSEYEHGTYEVPNGMEDAIKKDVEKNGETSSGKDQAGGNPLETFRKLLRDGTLNLVCDTSRLSEETIDAVYTKQKETVQRKSKKGENSTADLLKDLLSDEEGGWEDSVLDTTKEKSVLVCYAQQVFSHYTNQREKTIRYGIEYLISGSAQERDNLQHVISRLLIIRTALNYAYVRSDASLQAASLATATEIAGALGVPPLITAIQQTILLILSVEESCVDITALLDGKSVPVFKNVSNFQMKYSEICGVNKTVFRGKAKNYSDGGKGISGGTLNYQQYLWILLFMVSEQQLHFRTLDLIQNDLQKRYNATFSLEQCISGMQYQIEYDMPFLWGGCLPEKQKAGMVRKCNSGEYRYQ